MLLGVFILFLSGVNALVSETTGYLNFYEEPKTLSFEVENDSGNSQELSINVFSPLSYEIKGTKNTLEAGETALIEITFFPEKKFLNFSYKTTIYIELGKEKVKKEVSMSFNERMNCPVVFSVEQKENKIELTAFNRSIEEMDFQIKGFKEKGNWSVETKKFSLKAGEEKKFSLELNGFGEEKNFLIVRCTGFEEEIEVKLKENSTANPVIATGNFLFAGLGQIFTPINFILVVIAAILLIVFISRLVKRIQGEEQ
jgi:hypothetical protein